MKLYVATALLFVLCSVSYSAENSEQVRINSFNYVGNSRLAEICGQIVNQKTSPRYVKVVIDPQSKKPAHYNSVVGSDGQFCLSVITFTGKADAFVLE